MNANELVAQLDQAVDLAGERRGTHPEAERLLLSRFMIVARGLRDALAHGRLNITDRVALRLRDNLGSIIRALRKTRSEPVDKADLEILRDTLSDFIEYNEILALPHSSAERSVEREAAEAKGRLEEQLEQTRRQLEAKQLEVEATLKRLAETQAAAERASAQLLNQTADRGAKLQGQHFHESANNYKWWLFGWLAGAAFFFCMTWYYIQNHLSPEMWTSTLLNQFVGPVKPKEDNNGYTLIMIQQALPRLVMVAVFITGLVFCLRNFVVSRHNQILDRHRALSMDTFLDIATGAGNEEVRTQIVQYVANCVFTPQSTGYLKTDGDMPQMKQLSELLKKITPKTGKEE